MRLPGSKSIAARALVCRYVAGADTRLIDIPGCDDTRELRQAIEKLEEAVPRPADMIDSGREVVIPGILNLGNGGTTLRFMLAVVASIPGLQVCLDCGNSLRRRPLAPLIKALRNMGADIECLKNAGYPPLMVKGKRLKGGTPDLDANAGSSQYLSALMLASPLWAAPLAAMDWDISAPYIEMTRKVSETFRQPPAEFRIEGDWSAASYFYELALAMPGRSIVLENLPLPSVSLQGDAACCAIFNFLGVTTRRLDDDDYGAAEVIGSRELIKAFKDTASAFDAPMTSVPDLVPALAVGLCLAGIPYELSGIAHLKLKESNRLMALSSELAKAGYAVTVSAAGNALIWDGRRYPVAEDETFDAWEDHRMAMALSIIACRTRWIAIYGAQSVSKSFPEFFPQLTRLGFSVS